jgi:hypothetical protein
VTLSIRLSRSARQPAVSPPIRFVVLRRGYGHLPDPISDTLRELGHEVEPNEDRAVSGSDGVVLALGNARWFPTAFRSLAQMPREGRPLSVVWQSEPLPLPATAGFPSQPLHLREIAKIVLRDRRITDAPSNLRRLVGLAKLRLPDLLVVTMRSSEETLAGLGIEASTIVWGYHPLHQGRDLRLQRDIDVLFLGDLNVPRRKKLLRTLRRAGVEVCARGRWGDPRYFGEPRTILVNRAKIFLNLSRFPGQFSGSRLVLGMGNRSLVISEPMYRPDPFIPGTHYLGASVGEMPELIEHYLRDDAERQRVALRGHAFVTRELTTPRMVSQLLELIRARAATP